MHQPHHPGDTAVELFLDGSERNKSKTFAAKAADLKAKLMAKSDSNTWTYEPKLISGGWLQKKSQAGVRGFKRWQERWCKIDSASLSYFRTAAEDQNLGVIAVAQISGVEVLELKKGSCRFDITTQLGRSYGFLAHTREDCYNWVYTIHYYMERCKARPVLSLNAMSVRSEGGGEVPQGYECKVVATLLNPEGGVVCRRQIQLAETLDFHAVEDVQKLGDELWPKCTVRVELHANNDLLGVVVVELGALTEGNTKAAPAALTTPSGKESKLVLDLVMHFESAKYSMSKRSNQFGTDISSVLSTHVPGYKCPIPQVLLTMKDYLFRNGLTTEGIFRVAPEESEVAEVKHHLNKGDFRQCADVHCISHLIKVWCRDLPHRLLSDASPQKLDTLKTAEEAWELVVSIPQPTQSVVQWIIDLALQVSSVEANKMSPKALAIVFGPNLLPPMSDPMKELLTSKKVCEWFELAVAYRREHPPVMDDVVVFSPPSSPFHSPFPSLAPPADPASPSSSAPSTPSGKRPPQRPAGPKPPPSPNARGSVIDVERGSMNATGLRSPPPPPPAPFLGDILEPKSSGPSGPVSDDDNDCDVIDEEQAFSSVIQGLSSPDVRRNLRPVVNKKPSFEDPGVTQARLVAAIGGKARENLKHVEMPSTDRLVEAVRTAYLEEKKNLPSDIVEGEGENAPDG